MPYSNLQITAYMRSPIICDEWMPLDGVLLYQKTRLDLGHKPLDIPGASNLAQPKGEKMRGGKLPIKVIHAKDWYYAMSWAEWGPYTDDKDYWSKRSDEKYTDLVDFAGRRGKIDTSSGGYKAYRMPVFCRSTSHINWYCVGDLKEILALLNMTTNLGKKSSQGWGRVARWEIKEIEHDWSVYKDGKLMRGIPIYHIKDVTPKNIMLYGIRPSYWDKRNKIEIIMP